MTLTTGISMFGKMSVGVRRIETTPRIKSRMDATTKVYGLRSASRTIHIENGPHKNGKTIDAG
jgi:hypothetical protein